MKFVHSTGENYAIGFTVNITVFLVCRVLEAGINGASVHDLRHESSGGRWKDELRPVVEMVLCVLLITLMMMSGFIVLIHAISRPNKWAFRCRANVEGERVADRRVVDKLFQMIGPATVKLLVLSMVLVQTKRDEKTCATYQQRVSSRTNGGRKQSRACKPGFTWKMAIEAEIVWELILSCEFVWKVVDCVSNLAQFLTYVWRYFYPLLWLLSAKDDRNVLSAIEVRPSSRRPVPW